MEVLEDVYYGDYQGCQLPTKERCEVDRDRKRIDARKNELSKTLSETQQKELNIIVNALNEITSRENYYYFKNGFHFGFGIAKSFE